MRKLALITGGSSGIGFSIAQELCDEHDLAIVYRSDDEGAKRAAQELHHLNPAGAYKFYKKELLDHESATDVFEKICSDFLRSPDVLVHAAAPKQNFRLLVQSAPAEIERGLSVHLYVAMCLAKLVLPGMYERKFGRIVNLSSISARFMSRGMPVEYAAAKAAVEGFTKSLAIEVARRGITVNAVAPGLIETQRTADRIAELKETKERFNKLIPMGRVGVPADVAPAVKFLCSAEANYINGAVLSIDGGLSLGSN